MDPAGRGGPDSALVLAARDGDPRALNALVAESLPLVYNIVGRALNGHADVDDVVQETLLRMVRHLPDLRDPYAFRSWLVAITVRQVRDQEQRRYDALRRSADLDDAREVPDPLVDFAELTILKLGLTDQRREVAEATRWLDSDDRALLALWWLEEGGALGRAELASALELSTQHAAVRVNRMKEQMSAARAVVRALRAQPRCPDLAAAVRTWDDEPSPLWRKRLARHVRECALCDRRTFGLLPMERLLAGAAMVPVPASLAARFAGHSVLGGAGAGPSGGTSGDGSSAGGHSGHPGGSGSSGSGSSGTGSSGTGSSGGGSDPTGGGHGGAGGHPSGGQPGGGPSGGGHPGGGHGGGDPSSGLGGHSAGAHSTGVNATGGHAAGGQSAGAKAVGAKSVGAKSVGVKAVGAKAAGAHAAKAAGAGLFSGWTGAVGVAGVVAAVVTAVVAVVSFGQATPEPASAGGPATSASTSLSPTPSPTASSASPSPSPSSSGKAPAAPATPATSSRKGVSAWSFSGVNDALVASGARWYYTWATTHSGITTPKGVDFVPMIWGSGSVTSTSLNQAKAAGSKYLLGFNEPDMSAQANMTVDQALQLWPQLMATGLTLGSPSVAYGGATPGGWLDRFMSGAASKGYRVDFITLHWYGGDFVTTNAVNQLKSYIQAVYDRYHKPIWLTEYALMDFSNGVRLPTQAQQAAFCSASIAMLSSLSYLQRYAWFALPADDNKDSTGLYKTGPTPTEVGKAFAAAH